MARDVCVRVRMCVCILLELLRLYRLGFLHACAAQHKLLVQLRISGAKYDLPPPETLPTVWKTFGVKLPCSAIFYSNWISDIDGNLQEICFATFRLLSGSGNLQAY